MAPSTVKLKRSGFLIQLVATLCISLLGIQKGFICSWPSYTIKLFRSNETVLSMPMTTTHVSLLGSLSSVGGLLSTPFCSYAFNNFGRKYASMIMGLSFVLAWAIVCFTDDVYLVLLAMTLGGIGVAGQPVTAIFISEIVHDSIRGGMTACPSFTIYLGQCISNFMGGHLTYHQVLYTFLFSSVLTVVLLFLLKESPTYLVFVGRKKEATKSISFYGRLDKRSTEVETEMSNIQQQIDFNSEPQRDYEPVAANEIDLAEETGRPAKRISSWRYLKNSKPSQKSFFKMLILLTLVSMMGPMMLQVYAETIYTEAVPSLDANQCAVGAGLVFTIASLVCILAVDKFGRQSLLVYSAIFCGVSSLALGTAILFHWAPDWATALLIYLYCFSYTTGCANTPGVLMAEVFLPEVRSLCNTICMASFCFICFFTLGSFNFMVEMIGLGSVFCIFSVMCFTVAVYSKLYIPETKGLSMIEIQKFFH